MANVRGSFERDNANLDRNVAHCAVVLKSRPEKVMEASSIMEARTNVSTDQRAGPSSASDG